MGRRELLLGAAALGPLCGWPPAGAQPSGKVLKLDWLRPNAAAPGEFQSQGIPAALK